MGLTIFYRIFFLIFSHLILYQGIFYRLLSIPHNIVMDMNIYVIETFFILTTTTHPRMVGHIHTYIESPCMSIIKGFQPITWWHIGTKTWQEIIKLCLSLIWPVCREECDKLLHFSIPPPLNIEYILNTTHM